MDERLRRWLTLPALVRRQTLISDFACKADQADLWKRCVQNSIKEPPEVYNEVVLLAVLEAGKALDAGQLPEEVDQLVGSFGVSFAQADYVACQVSNIHPDGERFRLWWNLHVGMNEQGKRANQKPTCVLSSACFSVG